MISIQLLMLIFFIVIVLVGLLNTIFFIFFKKHIEKYTESNFSKTISFK